MQRLVQIFFAITFIATASAHDALGDYLQHRVRIVPHDDGVDVEIEITFDGERSLAERRKIDRDKNGSFSAEECALYLESVAADAEERVRMRVDDGDVQLIALHSPRLDMMDSRDLERHPHLLTLTFFSRSSIDAAKTVTVVDGLWADAPAIVRVEPVSTERVVLSTVGAGNPTGDSASLAGEARTITVEVRQATHRQMKKKRVRGSWEYR